MSEKNNLERALENAYHRNLSAHDHVLEEPEEWESTCRQLCNRHLVLREDLDQVCDDLDIPLPTAAYLLGMIDEHASPVIRRQHYVSAPTSGDLVPPMLTEDWALVSANKVGRAIYSIACGNPERVRHIVYTYAAAANSDKQIILSPPQMDLCNVSSRRYEKAVAFAKKLVDFVRELHVEHLRVGLVGYLSGPAGIHRLEAFRDFLGLDKDTPMRTHKPRNSLAPSSRRQIGLEVARLVEPGKFVVDGAFFGAMVLGAVVEVWRFAVHKPTKAGIAVQVSPAAGQPSFRPGTDMPPAMLLAPPLFSGGSFHVPPSREERLIEERRRMDEVALWRLFSDAKMREKPTPTIFLQLFNRKIN